MNRRVLPEEAYQSFFEAGSIGPVLGRELVRRYQEKRAAGHWLPDLGDFSV
jgi:hypothetical protein